MFDPTDDAVSCFDCPSSEEKTMGVGTAAIRYWYRDSAGNRALCSFKIKVIGKKMHQLAFNTLAVSFTCFLVCILNFSCLSKFREISGPQNRHSTSTDFGKALNQKQTALDCPFTVICNLQALQMSAILCYI